MTFGQKLHLLPQDERHIVRHLEKLAYKINAAETATIFNPIQAGLFGASGSWGGVETTRGLYLEY